MFGNIMVSIVIFIMSLVYYNYVFNTMLPKYLSKPSFLSYLGDPLAFYFLVVFNILFFMLVWSFLQTMFTDPGQIPTYWGFRVGDPEGRRRRYCLMCNLFKPERCHHCSSCEKCILNMDHHCPWVNNCVGFNNRKYFILLLVYVFLGTFFYWISIAYDVYLDVMFLVNYHFSEHIDVWAILK
jgi:hypothetical protein